MLEADERNFSRASAKLLRDGLRMACRCRVDNGGAPTEMSILYNPRPVFSSIWTWRPEDLCAKCSGPTPWPGQTTPR